MHIEKGGTKIHKGDHKCVRVREKQQELLVQILIKLISESKQGLSFDVKGYECLKGF